MYSLIRHLCTGTHYVFLRRIYRVSCFTFQLNSYRTCLQNPLNVKTCALDLRMNSNERVYKTHNSTFQTLADRRCQSQPVSPLTLRISPCRLSPVSDWICTVVRSSSVLKLIKYRLPLKCTFSFWKLFSVIRSIYTSTDNLNWY